MVSDFLLVFGVCVLSLALRSYRHPLPHRLGTLGIVATSFLAGWLIAGHWVIGLLFAGTWLLLPWVEILTRVRTMRLPLERTLQPRTPPSRATFPGFSEISEEIEAAGFEYIEDIGWEYDDQKQFFRIFYHEPTRTQAAISLVEHSEMAFYYLALTSRTKEGTQMVTWNYPFSYGLIVPPTLRVQRLNGEIAFGTMCQKHQEFLQRKGITVSELSDEHQAECVRAAMQGDMRNQVQHNIKYGLLARAGEDQIRYTVRGMFYLWMQFLRDFVRLS